jgi:hypothetical protein
VRIGVVGIEPDAALQHGNRVRDPPELAQADAVVVGDVRVVEHAVQDLEQRQRVGEETVLQQAEHVLLRLHARFRHGDDPDELVVHGDRGVPAFPGVVAGEVRDDRDLEGLRAGSAGVGRKHGRVEVPDGDLPDLGGGAFCHGQWAPFGAFWDLGSESTGWPGWLTLGVGFGDRVWKHAGGA